MVARVVTKLTPMVVLAIALLMPIGAVRAAATPAPAASSGQGLQLSPPIVNGAADPGQSAVINLTLLNISSAPLVVTTEADDFDAQGEDGVPQILLDEVGSTRYSLKQWVAAVVPITLQSQQKITVPVRINVPSDAEPGGHYAVIRFSGAAPSVNGTGVGLTASIASLVFFTVNGNISHHLSLVDVAVERSGTRHRFFEYGPFTLVERIKNDGSTHEQPKGNLVVTNLFGRTTTTVALSDKTVTILPNSIRKYAQDLPKKNLFGRYTVKGTLTYANGQQLVLPATSFWVIPYRLILVVLVIVALLATLLRLAIRRYNAYVIRRARR